MNLADFNLTAQFTDRVALVTGGTDGIGLHLATTLAQAGAVTYVCGRDAEKGRAAVEACPQRLRFIQTDLTDSAQSRALVQQIAAATGRLDYLVNNAADDARIDFEHATEAQFERMLAINLRPMFTVTQAALPLLRAGSGKAIVNLCTTNYMLGLTPFTLYNASKSGIIGFARSLARELGPDGIRVNVVSPGWIMTEKQLRLYVSEQDQRDLLNAQCLKRLMTASDVTPAVLFLLSSLASGVTGQNLVVDGGKVMQ